MPTYETTTWLEHSMTGAQKRTGLTNLEGMYDYATAYIDSITHSELFYTIAECAARYFTAATDGDDTGLIAETLDGLTADQIIDAGSPPGVIGAWTGTYENIPDGWYLCDGTNSTPNLVDRFVLCVGEGYARGTSGGALTRNVTASSVTIAGYALTGADIPSHTHPFTEYYRATILGCSGNSGTAAANHTGFNTNAATSDAHNHTTGSSFTGEPCDVTPPKYALCYIMRS